MPVVHYISFLLEGCAALLAIMVIPKITSLYPSNAVITFLPRRNPTLLSCLSLCPDQIHTWTFHPTLSKPLLLFLVPRYVLFSLLLKLFACHIQRSNIGCFNSQYIHCWFDSPLVVDLSIARVVPRILAIRYFFDFFTIRFQFIFIFTGRISISLFGLTLRQS